MRLSPRENFGKPKSSNPAASYHSLAEKLILQMSVGMSAGILHGRSGFGTYLGWCAVASAGDGQDH